MTSTRIDVRVAAGASVSGINTKLATTKRLMLTIAGMTIPKTITSARLRPALRPITGIPGGRRLNHDSASRLTAPEKTTQAITSIHHHRRLMSRAAGLSGLSADWSPPQPATSSEPISVGTHQREDPLHTDAAFPTNGVSASPVVIQRTAPARI